MVRKIIAAVAIVIAALAAVIVVARPTLDPDLLVGYWRLESEGAGPALLLVERDGAEYRLRGLEGPSAQYTQLSEEGLETRSVSEDGVSLTTNLVASELGEVGVTLIPSADGRTLRMTVIPSAGDYSEMPVADWRFVRDDGDPDQLADELEQLRAEPAPAPTTGP